MFLENGFNDFLSKPIKVSRLDSVLKKWIPPRKRRKAPADGKETSESVALPEICLPEMEGVDVAAGLARIGGSQKRYLDLLEIFSRDAQACSDMLEKISDDASLSSFITRIHALKSALANIGADGMSQTAAMLEKAGREADMPLIRDRFPAFRECLVALTARIGEVLAAARDGDGEKGADPEIGEALACLRKALDSKDIDAIYAARTRLQALPLTGETRGTVSEIAGFILTMEFQKASDAVASLLKQTE
jgi:HPt (histidine-containing phosphotransfer) domain-containing protein